jgi:GrpB-like predicted nucleotidyltransferase (UPF0157 family)
MEHKNQEEWPLWAREKIEIVPFDPDWLETGKNEVNKLLIVLSQFDINQIEHIGSTAVPGISAKHIIDLMARIESFDRIKSIIEKLRPDDWHYVPPELDGRPYRRFFVKVRDDKRVAHLHLMLKDEIRWEEQLLFRDKLRQNPVLVKEYSELKIKLANENRNNREAYTEAKTKFIKKVLENQKKSK